MLPRQSMRASVGPDHRVAILCEGQRFQDLPLADLGVEGCCIRVPAHLAGRIQAHPIQGIHLQAPGLPSDLLSAEVVWLQGRTDDPHGQVSMGLHFRDLPGSLRQVLETRILELSHRQPHRRGY